MSYSDFHLFLGPSLLLSLSVLGDGSLQAALADRKERVTIFRVFRNPISTFVQLEIQH